MDEVALAWAGYAFGLLATLLVALRWIVKNDPCLTYLCRDTDA